VGGEEAPHDWDMSDPDEQPGLDSQVTRYIMGLTK
jgi:hypothetical protein